MQLFLCTIENDKAYIYDQEAKHLGVVLRRKEGDQVLLTDGKGTKLFGQIEKLGKKIIELSILKQQTLPNPAKLHLAVAPTKNINRMEWLVEKACEIGITQITPLLCRHSERKILKTGKLQKRMQSAALQSLKYWIPQLNQIQPFERFITNIKEEQKFIAYCGEAELPLMMKNVKAEKNICVMIGPEGDFSPEEFHHAKVAGFSPVSFGKTRLRTETAALMACAIVQQKNA